MLKELEKIVEKVKQENSMYRVKITIRESRQPGMHRIYLQKHLNHKKESRSLDLVLFDKNEYMAQNKNNIAIAKEMRLQLENEILKDEIAGKPTTILKKVNSDNFLDYFEKISTERGQRNYRICRDHFIGYVQKDFVPFPEITNELCRGFIRYLKDDPQRSDRTVHNYMICFKAVLNSAVVDGLLTSNPALNLKVKFPKKEKGRLTFEQLKVLHQTPCVNQQLKNAFLFSCYTGLRKSDIINLKKHNIVDGYLSLITQKTKTSIKIKLNNTALSILNQQKKLIANTVKYCNDRSQEFDEERLFSFPLGGRSTIQLRQWFEAAGIKSDKTKETEMYSFHTARHTFISNIVEFSGNIVAAQKLVGHQDLKTTQVYTHLSDSFKDTAIDSLPELVED
ncbi:MAG: site-specific integrase [Candidatus Cloacimonetes bacterium]|nr:site-specific integrase [Candidatus Cloacimonadota bacterium]